MRKTSVYLSDEEYDDLREAARVLGRSRSDLIREGIQHVVRSAVREDRHFYSMGSGEGNGEPYRPWDPDELYRHVMGRED